MAHLNMAYEPTMLRLLEREEHSFPLQTVIDTEMAMAGLANRKAMIKVACPL